MMTCLNVGQRNRYRQGAIIYRLLNAPFLRARMVVDGGGLQRKTVTNILMAWVFTLPASILLSGVLYWLSLKLI